MALTYNQILRQVEKNCGLERGILLTDLDKKQDVTDDINLAVSDVLSTIFDSGAGGSWVFDDSSHLDYPIIETDLVAGQRDYSFTEDGAGNLILDIYRVMVKDRDGKYQEIEPVAQFARNSVNQNTDSMINGEDKQGTPKRYSKTGNGIFLDLIPSYSWRQANEGEKGLKVFINREMTYFDTDDTDKVPGFDATLHEYLALVPSYKIARNNSLNNVSLLERDLEVMKLKIKKRYGMRERDITRGMRPAVESTK
jgi:hypothetical protein